MTPGVRIVMKTLHSAIALLTFSALVNLPGALCAVIPQAEIPQDATIVNVDGDGNLQFNSESMEFAALADHLRDFANSNQEKTVVVVAAVNAPFKVVVRVVDAARAFGIEHVGILRGQSDGSVRMSLPPMGATVLSVDRSGIVRLDGKKIKIKDISSHLKTTLGHRNDHVVYVQAYGALNFDAVAVVIDAAKAAGATQVGLLSSNQ